MPGDPNQSLALRPLPEVAVALRQRAELIVQRWTEEVERDLPDANPLTVRQVRDSIPMVLEKIALALELATPQTITVLEEVGTAHGVARFQQDYDLEEVIIEYRILRRLIFEEMYRAIGFKVSFIDAVPVDVGIDTALQRGVVTYVRHLSTQLRSAAETESKFLAFLSHDLRNNLGAVTLRLALLEQHLSGHERFAQDAKEIEALQASIQQTIDGMDRLLQAERLRREAVALNLMPVDLRRLIDELIARVQRDADAKGLRIESDIPTSAVAHSDRELLVLALQNLLGNAIKYSQTGTIRLRAREHESGWIISVSDQGPGIAPERVESLFQAFTRGDSHGQAGMGLGLSIASHAARLLGSELTVESVLGKGTTFTFRVPPATPSSEQKR